MGQLDMFADAEAEEPVPATFAARPRPTTAPTATATAMVPPAAAPAAAVAGAPRGVARTGANARAARAELPAVQAAIPAPRRVVPLLPGRASSIGLRLGEAVAEAWHASNWAGSRIDIPVSIIGALALIPIKGHVEHITRTLTECSDAQLIRGFREVYVHAWSQRPGLGALMAP